MGLRVLRIKREFIVDVWKWLQGRCNSLIQINVEYLELPTDAKCLELFYDFRSRCFELILESSEWEEATLYQETPLINDGPVSQHPECCVITGYMSSTFGSVGPYKFSIPPGWKQIVAAVPKKGQFYIGFNNTIQMCNEDVVESVDNTRVIIEPDPTEFI